MDATNPAGRLASPLTEVLDPTRDCKHGQLARSCDRCEDAREIAELRAELAEWHKLRDPVNLHVNLLRGMPAKMTNEQIWHLVADDRDRLADLELLAKHESDCAEAFKAEAAALRALVQDIADKRHTYGWGPEADAAIEAARLALGPNGPHELDPTARTNA